MTPAADGSEWARRASGELAAALAGVASGERDPMADAILAARRSVCAGLGRAGLRVRALCMRLMPLGCDAHGVFDLTTPPRGPGPLLTSRRSPGPRGAWTALRDRVAGDGAHPGRHRATGRPGPPSRRCDDRAARADDG